MAKEYIAKESTSQAILTKATETDTAVDGIVGKVGETNDSSGSTTSGGIFAKLNKVITDTTSLLTRLTTARAASLDRIGTAADSGATTTTGSVMGKLNVVMEKNGQKAIIPGNDIVKTYTKKSFSGAKLVKAGDIFICPYNGVVKISAEITTPGSSCGFGFAVMNYGSESKEPTESTSEYEELYDKSIGGSVGGSSRISDVLVGPYSGNSGTISSLVVVKQGMPLIPIYACSGSSNVTVSNAKISYSIVEVDKQ